MKRHFSVVYLWKGERHRHSTTFTNRSDANDLVREFWADGWTAWVE